MQKPQTVSTAVNLLWMSIAISLVSTSLKYVNTGGVLASDAPTLFLHSVVVFGFAIRVFLIFKIAAGKNWARVVYFGVFMIDVTMLPFMLADCWQSLLINILFMTEVGLQSYALVLLFTQPARFWFLRTWRGHPDVTNKEK